MSGAVVKGVFTFRFHRPDGSVYAERRVPNSIPVECLNYLLGTGFRGTSPKTTFAARIILDAGFTGVSASDTYAAHPWAEFTSAGRTYLQLDNPGAAGGQMSFSRLSLGDLWSVPQGTAIRGAALYLGLTAPNLTPGPYYSPQPTPNPAAILVATAIVYNDPAPGFPAPYGLPLYPTPPLGAPPDQPVSMSVGYVIQAKPV